MYLLLGNPADSCCAGVLARLTALGLPVQVVTSPLASPARIVWRLDDDALMSRLALDDQAAEISGVLVRGAGGLDPAGWAPEDHAYAQAEMLAATLAWLAGLPCPVINRPSAALWYRGRASLLDWLPLLRRCGLPVPDQLITNDPAEARAFGQFLSADAVPGAVYAPLTGEGSYLIATEAAWQGLAGLQERLPVRLSEPHGATQSACIVGGQVFWDHDPGPEATSLTTGLVQFAALSGLDFVELVTAPIRRGIGVVMVEPMPVLEHFAPPTRARILDALTALLAPVAAERTAPS